MHFHNFEGLDLNGSNKIPPYHLSKDAQSDKSSWSEEVPGEGLKVAKAGCYASLKL